MAATHILSAALPRHERAGDNNNLWCLLYHPQIDPAEESLQPTCVSPVLASAMEILKAMQSTPLSHLRRADQAGNRCKPGYRI